MFDQFKQESRPFNYESTQCECMDHEPATFDRLPLFLPLIVVMIVSTFFLFGWDDRVYGVMLGTFVPYTAVVILGTFSAVRGQRPYFFECPVVRKSIQRLSLRHAGFLVAIMVIVLIAFSVKTHLPASWVAAGSDGSPFSEVLFVACVVIAMIEAWTNRSLLERAHQQAFPGRMPNAS